MSRMERNHGGDKHQAATPNKKGKKTSVLYRIITLLLIGIICVSGYKVASTLLEYRKAQDEYKKIEKIALVDPLEFTGEIDWDALLEVNSDVQGWIYLKDSNINYPVVKGVDNEQYLHHLINGEYNYSGTIFIDYRCQDNFAGRNTILHGHHMKDRSMFANLSKFVNEPDYYKNHKQFELITPTEKYHIAVFSAFVVEADENTYQCDFATPEEMIAYADAVKSQSAITTDDVEVTADDRLVTFSTCVNADGNARYIIVGKLVKWTDKEKAEALEKQAKIDKDSKKTN